MELGWLGNALALRRDVLRTEVRLNSHTHCQPHSTASSPTALLPGDTPGGNAHLASGVGGTSEVPWQALMHSKLRGQS